MLLLMRFKQALRLSAEGVLEGEVRLLINIIKLIT